MSYDQGTVVDDLIGLIPLLIFLSLRDKTGILRQYIDSSSSVSKRQDFAF